MGSFSIWHWIVVLTVLTAYLVPGYKIISKAGFSGFWVILGLVPVLNVVLLWVFAFAAWPVERSRTA